MLQSKYGFNNKKVQGRKKEELEGGPYGLRDARGTVVQGKLFGEQAEEWAWGGDGEQREPLQCG